jgi:hypothetical protein
MTPMSAETSNWTGLSRFEVQKCWYGKCRYSGCSSAPLCNRATPSVLWKQPAFNHCATLIF